MCCICTPKLQRDCVLHRNDIVLSSLYHVTVIVATLHYIYIRELATNTLFRKWPRKIQFALELLRDIRMQDTNFYPNICEAWGCLLVAALPDLYSSARCSTASFPHSSAIVLFALQKEGDLLKDELDQLWESAPKFQGSKEERIDLDSFVQIYRDIDDLFEEDEQPSRLDSTPITVPDNTSSSANDDTEDDTDDEGQLATGNNF